jgi:hypothetical protein
MEKHSVSYAGLTEICATVIAAAIWHQCQPCDRSFENYVASLNSLAIIFA